MFGDRLAVAQTAMPSEPKMKIALAATALLLLAACSSPYEAALESRTTPRPMAPVTKADAAALAPYEAAAYFKSR